MSLGLDIAVYSLDDLVSLKLRVGVSMVLFSLRQPNFELGGTYPQFKTHLEKEMVNPARRPLQVPATESEKKKNK